MWVFLLKIMEIIQVELEHPIFFHIYIFMAIIPPVANLRAIRKIATMQFLSKESKQQNTKYFGKPLQDSEEHSCFLHFSPEIHNSSNAEKHIGVEMADMTDMVINGKHSGVDPRVRRSENQYNPVCSASSQLAQKLRCTFGPMPVLSGIPNLAAMF